MEKKYTQGRWYLQEYTDAYTNIIRCDSGNGFEGIYIANLHGQGGKNRENAKLIAAAPDMLEALEGVLRIKDLYLPAGPFREEHEGEAEALSKMINAIEQAIKKATT